MPTIEIEVSERIQRHLAAVRVMSCMVFPDAPRSKGRDLIAVRGCEDPFMTNRTGVMFAQHLRTS
jgi:hypothetical protein